MGIPELLMSTSSPMAIGGNEPGLGHSRLIDPHGLGERSSDEPDATLSWTAVADLQRARGMRVLVEQ